jgi:hypothetical protein
MDWTDLAQDKDQWWALVNTVMKLWVPKKKHWFTSSQKSFLFSIYYNKLMEWRSSLYITVAFLALLQGNIIKVHNTYSPITIFPNIIKVHNTYSPITIFLNIIKVHNTYSPITIFPNIIKVHNTYSP